MSAASSHQKSRSNRSRLVAIDATNATVMAIAMSSIIPGWRLFDLVPPTGEERPTRPGVEHGAERRPDQLHAVEVEVVAEPVHDHVARQHHGHGEGEAQPEPAPEHRDVVAVVAVVAAMASVTLAGSGRRLMTGVVDGR